jgi:hypothetical protein
METAMFDETTVHAGPPPNLAAYLTNGFNAKRFDFAGMPIFGPLTYTQAQKVDYGLLQSVYGVPDGYHVDGVAAFFTTTKKKAIQSDSDFEQTFSFGLSAEGEVRRMTAKVSASVSSQLKMSGKLFHSVNQEYFLSFSIQTVCRIERARDAQGTPDKPAGDAFMAAANKLPKTPASDADWNQYFAFFDLYGTHFLLSGHMGGYFMTETKTDKLIVQDRSAAEIAAAIEAGVSVTVASGSFKVDSAYSQNKFLSDMAESMTTRYECRGGLFSTEVRPWVISVFRNPILLPGVDGMCEPVMASIAEVFPKDRQTAAKTALRRYLGDGRILGDSVEVPLNAVKTSVSGGLLTAQAHADKKGVAQLVASINPKIASWLPDIRGSVHNDPDSLDYLSVAQLVVPVGSSGVEQLVTLPRNSSSAGVVSGFAEFVPLENPWVAGACMIPASSDPMGGAGPVKPKAGETWNNATYKPRTDAMLLVTAFARDQGARGYVTLKDENNTVVAGCAVHLEMQNKSRQYTEFASFAVPVRGGVTYKLSATNSSANTEFTATQFGFTNGIGLAAASAREPAITYEAESDGFLIGCIGDGKIEATEKQAVLTLLSGGERGELVARASSPAAAMAAKTWIFYGTAVLPVRRGEHYRAMLDTPSASAKPDCFLTFVPLTASVPK